MLFLQGKQVTSSGRNMSNSHHDDLEISYKNIKCGNEYEHRLKFHLARLDSTRHIRRVEPMRFGCVELVEEHSSTRSTRGARLARHDELDWLDTSSSTGATCNLVMITVIHLLISYSLIN